VAVEAARHHLRERGVRLGLAYAGCLIRHTAPAANAYHVADCDDVEMRWRGWLLHRVCCEILHRGFARGCGGSGLFHERTRPPTSGGGRALCRGKPVSPPPDQITPGNSNDKHDN
jgi:hypothetical protein